MRPSLWGSVGGYFRNSDECVRAWPKAVAGKTGEEGVDRGDAEAQQLLGVAK